MECRICYHRVGPYIRSLLDEELCPRYDVKAKRRRKTGSLNCMIGHKVLTKKKEKKKPLLTEVTEL